MGEAGRLIPIGRSISLRSSLDSRSSRQATVSHGPRNRPAPTGGPEMRGLWRNRDVPSISSFRYAPMSDAEPSGPRRLSTLVPRLARGQCHKASRGNAKCCWSWPTRKREFFERPAVPTDRNGKDQSGRRVPAGHARPGDQDELRSRDASIVSLARRYEEIRNALAMANPASLRTSRNVTSMAAFPRAT